LEKKLSERTYNIIIPFEFVDTSNFIYRIEDSFLISPMLENVYKVNHKINFYMYKTSKPFDFFDKEQYKKNIKVFTNTIIDSEYNYTGDLQDFFIKQKHESVSLNSMKYLYELVENCGEFNKSEMDK
jgi:hypothetical protein